MSAPRFILFDDARARGWEPFAGTRPAGELRFGCQTLRARMERALGLRCEGYLSHGGLTGWDEQGAPPVLSRGAAQDPGRVTLLLSTRLVLEPDPFDTGSAGTPPIPTGVAGHEPDPAAGGRAPLVRLTAAGETVGWWVAAGHPLPDDVHLLEPGAGGPAPGAPGQELRATVLRNLWELVERNGDRLRRDARDLWADSATPAGAVRIGDHALSLAPGSQVEPGVVLDLRAGPIRLEDGVRVEGPARLTGPLHIDRGTIVFGGHVGTSSIGPVCKLRGEVADCVWLGYANKAHDGYLGHALVGRWANLGAFTTNSDLKNNYGPVSVWTPEGRVDTGLLKVGCFLGDHVRTGIGTLLNTGTVIGAGSNVFGGDMPPTFVPPFSWGRGSELTEYRLEKFLEVAERAMARRDLALTPGVRATLERAWHASADLRKAYGATGA